MGDCFKSSGTAQAYHKRPRSSHVRTHYLNSAEKLWYKADVVGIVIRRNPCMTIHFGTDGWRAVISEEFTFANVGHVAQAIADMALSDSNGATPTYVVGYDTRFLSDRYAQTVAGVLAANGVRVLLCERFAATPVVSYAIVTHQADGGVMITASHNPPRYNGLKLKAAYGGSASPGAATVSKTSSSITCTRAACRSAWT